MVVCTHAFDLVRRRQREEEFCGLWFTQRVLGQPRLHSEALTFEKKERKENEKITDCACLSPKNIGTWSFYWVRTPLSSLNLSNVPPESIL